MNPKEKAQELIDKFSDYATPTFDEESKFSTYNSSKQCALISVDEIMHVLSILPYGMQYLSEIDYWEGVKEEINKL